MEAEQFIKELKSQNRHRKSILDNIIEKNCANPAEGWYIDIIVKRKFVNTFIEDITKQNFLIGYVSWWEYSIYDAKYGLGGCKSKFFDGWFWEICFGDDEIDISKYLLNDSREDIINNINSKYKELIEEKKLTFANGEEISYKEHDFLTPGFSIVVPDAW